MPALIASMFPQTLFVAQVVLPPIVVTLLPYVGAAALGVAVAQVTVDKIPRHANKVRAGAWVVAGAAIGTAIAPGLGTVVGAVVGGLVAWFTS
jgi:hypothetical protein